MGDPLALPVVLSGTTLAGKRASPEESRHHGTGADAGVAEQGNNGFRMLAQFRGMDAARDEKRIQLEPAGAGDVGFDAIADDERARGGSHGPRLRNGAFEYRGIRLAVIDDRSTQRLVEPRDGAGAVDQLVAALHDNVRIGAEEREPPRFEPLEHAAIILGAFIVVV